MSNVKISELIKDLNVKDDQTHIFTKLIGDEFKNYASKLRLNNVLVFGSVITGDFNEESDVDIAILGENQFHISEVLRLELFLEDLLEREIDVVDLKNDKLDIFIKIDILNKGKVIYSADDNESLEKLKEEVDWYYRENEYYFECRKRDLLS